ncbi:unnamed protein product [Ambrosiozyma monospora]|uniref:Unnamed protein product n=1 Tax=Ambrosiozyma monospora TaxID=43982 RepID=A0A9W6Z718_AMBMO|nr:unnamed protein product [Ambrosiozyma monospora]
MALLDLFNDDFLARLKSDLELGFDPLPFEPEPEPEDIPLLSKLFKLELRPCVPLNPSWRPAPAPAAPAAVGTGTTELWSRVKTQDSRLKSQDSRLKTHQVTTHESRLTRLTCACVIFQSIFKSEKNNIWPVGKSLYRQYTQFGQRFTINSIDHYSRKFNIVISIDSTSVHGKSQSPPTESRPQCQFQFQCQCQSQRQQQQQQIGP